MLSRRKLFQIAATVAAAPVLGAKPLEWAENTGSFHWSGWVDGAGYWWAEHPTTPGRFLVRAVTSGADPEADKEAAFKKLYEAYQEA